MTSLRDTYIAQMTPRKGQIKPVHRLRWVYHFVDGKSKVGIWNGASNRFEDSAASINKSNLIAAVIQSEDFYGYGVKTLFECDGHDYVTAKWIGASSTGAPMGKWNVEAVKLYPDIIGLSFLTRKERVYVFVDGSIRRRPHRAGEDIEKIREHNLRG